MTPGEELAQSLGAPVGSLDSTKIVPMLCEREEAGLKVLSRKGWLFELKLDGVRIIADKQTDRVTLSYRKLRDATASYPEVALAVRSLVDTRLVLDGEIVAFDEQGRPDFQRLGHRIQTGPGRAMRSPVFVPVVYVVFDVLAIGSYDVRGMSLEARKEILSRIIPAGGLANGLIRRHPTFEEGKDLFRLCQDHRLEGVVAKKLGSTYKVGERSFDWLKIKAELDAEFVVIGWTEGESDRARLGALDLGAYEGDRLVFRGRVGSGLDASTMNMLLERLTPIEVPYPVAEGKYSPKPKRHHCLPELVVSVRYGGFSLDPSGARFLRFPVFRGVRPDVSPKDCTAGPDDGGALVWPGEDLRVSGGSESAEPRESSGDEDAVGSPPSPLPTGPTGPAPRARRIHVTAPSQPLLHDGTTKAELCAYFEAVVPALLRHAHGRACMLRRPDGTALWPPPTWTPKFVRTMTVRAAKNQERGFVVDSIDVLLFAVEAGSPCIEHRPFIEDRPDVADFVAVRVTALEAAGKTALASAARAVRDLTAEIGLPAAAQSGGARIIEVLVGVGAAPAASVAPLGTLLTHLVNVPAGITIAPIDVVGTPFTPCAGESGDPVVVTVPIGWDELDAIDIGAIHLSDALARGLDAMHGDALDPIRDASVDVARATKAIERIVAARTG